MSRSIVGLDLSLTSTGVAILHPGGQPWVGTINSTGTKQDSWDTRYRRLGDIANRICCAVPDGALVALEAPSYGSSTGSQHDRSGLWWMVYDLLAGTTRTVLPIPPAVRAKYATGKGNAGKDAVLAAAVRRFPEISINSNDVADAVWLLAIGARLGGCPIDGEAVPKLNMSALESLPEMALPSGANA